MACNASCLFRDRRFGKTKHPLPLQNGLPSKVLDIDHFCAPLAPEHDTHLVDGNSESVILKDDSPYIPNALSFDLGEEQARKEQARSGNRCSPDVIKLAEACREQISELHAATSSVKDHRRCLDFVTDRVTHVFTEILTRLTKVEGMMQRELDNNLEKFKVWANDEFYERMKDAFREGAGTAYVVDRSSQEGYRIPDNVGGSPHVKSACSEPSRNGDLQGHGVNSNSDVVDPNQVLLTKNTYTFDEDLSEVLGEFGQKIEHIREEVTQIRTPPKRQLRICLMKDSTDDQSGCSMQSILDAAASMNEPIEKLQDFLNENRSIANMRFEEVDVGGRLLTHCSLLAAAVMNGLEDRVELLLDYKANPDSTYGFLAGISGMSFSCPCAVDTIAHRNERMLDLLLKRRADLEAVASNGANMVWQCCYFGRDQMLRKLMSRGLSFHALSQRGESQHEPGVTFSPLHISVIMAFQKCSNLLLEARVEIDAFNEKGESALDAAIRYCRPELVTFLVRNGAKVANIEKSSNGTHKLSFVRNIFEVEEPNSVMVHALALGLRSQPMQVASLKKKFLPSFFESGMQARTAILEALFIERDLHFKRADSERGIDHRKTAVLRKNQIVHGGQGSHTEYKYPCAISSSFSFQDIQEKVNHPTEEMYQFINSLTPQKSPLTHSCYSYVKGKLFSQEYEFTPIVVYECLVPGIQHDLRFLKTVAEVHAFDVMYLNPHCQAITAFAWRRLRKYAIIDCFMHCLLLLFFLWLASQVNYRPNYVFHWDARDDAQVIAAVTLPVWLYELVTELSQLAVFVRHRWTLSYICSSSNLLDLTRVVADGAVLIPCLMLGMKVAESLYFKVFMAGVCFVKWTKMLYCLTPFRECGFPVMPILFTLQDIGPSVAIMFVYYFGVAHAFVALDVIPKHYTDTTLLAFFFGLTGDFEIVEPYFHEDDPDSIARWTLQMTLCFATFLAPIILMNLFIASMSSSYSIGILHAEELYQHRCAQAVFNNSCTQFGVHVCCGRRSAEKVALHKKERLWYSRDRDCSDDRYTSEHAIPINQ